MIELNLPHIEPINFAKYVVSKKDEIAVVKVKFDNIPSLPILVEAAAQSGAAFSDNANQEGFLVTLKNIKLLNKPCSMEYNIKVCFKYNVESLNYFNFEVYDKEIITADGIFVIALQ